MEMSIPRRIRAKISEINDLRRDQGRHRENTAAAMPAEGDRDHRDAAMHGPCAYAYQYSAEVQRITDHGVSQREEQSDDIR